MDTGGKERPGPAGRVRSGTVPEAGTQPDAEPGNAPVTAQYSFRNTRQLGWRKAFCGYKATRKVWLFIARQKGYYQQTNFFTTKQKQPCTLVVPHGSRRTECKAILQHKQRKVTTGKTVATTVKEDPVPLSSF